MTVLEEQRPGGGEEREASERASDDGAAPRPRPPLRRSIPSDPDLAKRVLSVPDSAVARVKNILLSEERDPDDATLVADFLSSGEDDVDATINQFLRAVGGTDAAAATTRLLATLRWRRDASPATASCETCRRNPGAHYQHVVGSDSLGRPVIYSVLSLARGTRDVRENTEHMVSVFEAAIRTMEHNKKRTARSVSSGSSDGDGGDGPRPPSPLVAEQWIWVSDLFGFTASKDLDPRVAKAFIGLLGSHYPERLARFVIVGAPALFSALWSALKRHVCDDTARKIAFVKWDGEGLPGGKTCVEFEELGLGGKLGEWILRECRQNRCPVASRLKRYPYARAHEDEAASVVDGHDLRGTDEHVAMLRENPSLVAGFRSSSELSEEVAKLGTTD